MEAKDKVLNEVLDIIKLETTQVSFDSWFRKLELHEIDEELRVVYLGVYMDDGNHLALTILQNRYMLMLERAFETVLKQRVRVVIKNRQDYLDDEETEAQEVSRDEDEFRADESCTFANFVVGENNKFAYTASYAVAETPGTLYNPLLLYGESGLGKTHLLKAIGSHVDNYFSEKIIIYVSSEKFTNELIKAIKKKQTWQFRERYRRADVLIIDDIQFLEGKDGIQEEFFHTFNELHEEKRQIVISSDRSPDRLENLDKRLQKRFQWSMMVEIQVPDFDTRVAILTKKAKDMGITVDESVLEVFRVIANEMTSNVRELEGALTRLIAFSKIFKEDINIEFARKTLTDIFRQKAVEVTPDKIKRVVCQELHVTLKDMDSNKRDASISKARQIAMYLVREMTDSSFPEVGKHFNGKHYTTVMHAHKKIEAEIAKDVSVSSMVQALEYKIRME